MRCRDNEREDIVTIKKYVDTSALGDTLRETWNLVSLRWTGLDLNRTATSLSKKKLEDWGVGAPHAGFQWEDGDAKTTHWYPQGITGLRFGDRKWVVISWYGKDDYKPKGVRLSFCDVTDMSSVRYRHVLLVEPAEPGNSLGVYQPIVMHAGGMASVGDTLYVVDSKVGGVRTFDVGRILPAEADPNKDRCGIDASTKRAYAFDYRYILPQTARYEMDQGEGTHFSFCSTDWSVPARPRLLTGNYHLSKDKGSDYYNPPAMLAWWILDGPRIAGLERTLVWGIEGVQGAESIGDKVLASCSSAVGYGHTLLVGSANDFQGTKLPHDWPNGCEDMHFSPHSRNLWCLTEHKDGPGRFVFAVRGTDVGV